MNMISNYLVTTSQVTIITDGQTLVVPQDHVSYQRVIDYLKVGDYAEAIKIADAAQTINNFGQGQVYVQDGVVCHNGKQLDNSLTRRIMSMIRDGFDVNPMVKFLENLMMNPSGRAVSELYRFLEHNNLPITDDGFFLAYKNVCDDYTDKHSGTFDNSIGMVCEMPRNEVMDDPNQTCSAGLHFCSIEYLQGFWGTSGHTMIVKIDPADVVSIPVDYNNSKGRCCRYRVIGEHHDGVEDTLSESSVYTTSSPAFDEGYEKGFNFEDAKNPYHPAEEAYQEWYNGYEEGEVQAHLESQRFPDDEGDF